MTAVLSQDEGTQPTTSWKCHPIAFYLATFSPTEQNYDAYDLEFLRVIKAIDHWRPYLIWTQEPFVVTLQAGQAVRRGHVGFAKAMTRVLGFWIVVGDRGPLRDRG